jgi:hypothetical protein
LLQSYLKGAKLRSWLSYPQCPPAVQEFKVLLDHAYSDTLGDHHSSTDSVDSTELQKGVAVPPDLRPLVNRCTSLRAHVKLAGVVYSRSSAHFGNFLVMFYPSGNHMSSPVPGSIKYIYEEAGSLIFAVRRQCTLPADGNNADAYATYPHFPAKLYSSAFSETLESVQIGWIVGHYARWMLEEDIVVVLSLSQVGTFFP